MSNLNKSEAQISEIKHQGMQHVRKLTYCSTKNIQFFFDEPVIYEFNFYGIKFEFFAHLKKKSEFFYIFNQAAVDLKKYTLPVFHRWSWTIECPYSALSINDPTLYLDKLKIGWFQGTENRHYLPIACNILLAFANQLDIERKNILFCGSSAGGFTSLMMAGYIRNSSAFVINPQTDIRKYFKTRLKELLTVSFSNISAEHAESLFVERFSVIDFYLSRNHIPRIYYLQDFTDDHHWKNHYQPFIFKLSEVIATNKDYWFDKIQFQSELYSYGGHKIGTKAVSCDYFIDKSQKFMMSNKIGSLSY